MVASREMRAIRELSLAAPLALAGLAIFFGGGPGNGSIMWLGGGALADHARCCSPRAGVPGGLLALAAARRPRRLARALRSRGRCCPTARGTTPNRALVYLLFARSGSGSPRARESSRTASASCSERSWSGRSRGKVLPLVHDYGPPGLDAAERPCRAVEPARAARRVRAAARALAAAARRDAARLRAGSSRCS